MKKSSLRNEVNGKILTGEELEQKLISICVLESTLGEGMEPSKRVKRWGGYISSMIPKRTRVKIKLIELDKFNKGYFSKDNINQEFILSYNGYNVSSISAISIISNKHPLTDVILFKNQKNKFLVTLIEN